MIEYIYTLPVEPFLFLAGLIVGTIIAMLVHSHRMTLANLRAQNQQAQLEERLKRIPELSLELAEAQDEISELNHDLADLREKNGSTGSTISAQLLQISRADKSIEDLRVERNKFSEDRQILLSRLTKIKTELDNERKQSSEKLILLTEAKEELSNQFKTLANEILEEKSKKFTEQNQTNLTQLLTPLKTKLGDFQGKVEEVYFQESKDRSALSEQVKQLMDLNRQLSSDAHNLTKALKGQSKTQGNWGELILERVLEMSGLRKGQEYDVQENHTRNDGSRAQPDVVIHLPDSRHLIVDAKVSLNAYNDYVNAEDDNKRKDAVKRHLESMRSHIKGLSGKNYQLLYGLESLDFVIMFVPIESAFILGSTQDATLWQDAWNKNVLIVSPSTLLFVIRTVAHLWRQEQQSRNAQEIAHRGAELYNKFVGFVEDLTKVGERLNQAQNAYDNAFNKLTSGKGNIIRQTELLKELGVKPKKTLPADIVSLALEDSQCTPQTEITIPSPN
ncbi:DNA recombination protein RmuC [Maridesulfovibrio ferrireducens]|uniref:DNA recombination protein RmuC n=1 Tax=Maridesulfovibrio ferrireducens TaxID=246191 RepID=A0A1G9IXW4_9BACT|nr:DNA recombination protein RmuC [Maridesulfovibrio ferrireducens]SDL29925.1 DNA recombination protein RmuC [Maridesulfovibrio ferrireducens]